jgi:hypothetical protein
MRQNRTGQKFERQEKRQENCLTPPDRAQHQTKEKARRCRAF